MRSIIQELKSELVIYEQLSIESAWVLVVHGPRRRPEVPETVTNIPHRDIRKIFLFRKSKKSEN